MAEPRARWPAIVTFFVEGPLEGHGGDGCDGEEGAAHDPQGGKRARCARKAAGATFKEDRNDAGPGDQKGSEGKARQERADGVGDGVGDDEPKGEGESRRDDKLHRAGEAEGTSLAATGGEDGGERQDQGGVCDGDGVVDLHRAGCRTVCPGRAGRDARHGRLTRPMDRCVEGYVLSFGSR